MEERRCQQLAKPRFFLVSSSHLFFSQRAFHLCCFFKLYLGSTSYLTFPIFVKCFHFCKLRDSRKRDVRRRSPAFSGKYFLFVSPTLSSSRKMWHLPSYVSLYAVHPQFSCSSCQLRNSLEFFFRDNLIYDCISSVFLASNFFYILFWGIKFYLNRRRDF